MKKFYTIFLLAVMMNAAGALSQVPKTMSFQGLLVTPSTGNPVADGTYSFLFNLYDISTGGSPLWFEIQSSVNVSGGLYNVVLGSVKPFDVPFNKPYFLEVVVGGTTLSPRIELTSSAYLLNSHILDLSDGTLTGSKIGKGIQADSITSGILPLGRLSGITSAQLNPAAGITSDQITSLDASKLTGTINSSNFDASLADLSDGLLSGSRLDTGINASNITRGTLSLARLSGITHTELNASAGITNAQIASLDASKLTGTLPLGRLSGITSSELDAAAGITSGQIASLDAAKLTGTVPLAQLSGIKSSQLDAAAGITSSQINSFDASKLTGTVPLLRLSGITGSQLSASAGITGSQLSGTAGIVSGQITSLDGAKLTGTLGAVNGSAITNLNADNLSSGTVPLAQLSGITSTQLSASAGITSG